MMSTRKAMVKAKDVDIDELRDEAKRLRKKLRLLEEDSTLYRSETDHTLSKQNTTMSELEREQLELQKDIKVAGSLKNKLSDEGNTQTLTNLLRDEQKTMNDISEQEVSLRWVNKQISELETFAQEMRKECGGELEKERRLRSSAHGRRVITNRINQATTAFSAALEENRVIREQSEHVNIQKEHFDKMRVKLNNVSDKQVLKKEHLSQLIIEKQQLRRELFTRTQNMNARNEREKAAHSAEMCDLMRVIDHDSLLKDFMTQKDEDRTDLVEETRREILEKKMLHHIKTLDSEVERYNKIFGELHEVSGEQEIDRMVRKFIHTEDTNFADYAYCKQQFIDMQDVENTINGLKEHINEQGIDEEQLNTKHRQIIRELERSTAKVNVTLHKTETELKSETKCIGQISGAVDFVFRKMECDDSSIVNKLGSSEGSKEKLVIQHLAQVQQRAAQIMQAIEFARMKNETPPRGTSKKEARGSVPQGVKFQEAANKVILLNKIIPDSIGILPEIGDIDECTESDGEGEDIENRPEDRPENRPLTREMLESRASKDIEEIMMKEHVRRTSEVPRGTASLPSKKTARKASKRPN